MDSKGARLLKRPKRICPRTGEGLHLQLSYVVQPALPRCKINHTDNLPIDTADAGFHPTKTERIPIPVPSDVFQHDCAPRIE